MKSIQSLASEPAGIPLLADEVVEFHAARLLLLLEICGQRGHIDGLTKLAKLDFFVRYPEFFRKASLQLGNEALVLLDSIESGMVRHHYGPWDKRYYHVLSYLESKQLIEVNQYKKSFRFALTDHGKETAKRLEEKEEFHLLCEHMGQVKKIFGPMSGAAIKKLIYKIFDKEVAEKSLGEAII